ncbi:hypothetical protein LXL04_029951 [Taraxacum kok-saghyz]
MAEKRFDSGEDEETRLTTTSRVNVKGETEVTSSFEDNIETKQMKKHGDTILSASSSRGFKAIKTNDMNIISDKLKMKNTANNSTN